MNTEMKTRHASDTPFYRGKSTSGFTVVEMIVSVALTVILVGAVYQTFSQAQQIFDRGSARLAVYSDIRAAMNLMGRDLIGVTPTSGRQSFSLAQNVTSGFDEYGSEIFGVNPNGWEMQSEFQDQSQAGAADMMAFIASSSTADQVTERAIAYRPVPTRDPELLTEGEGEPETVRFNRVLFELQRISIPPEQVLQGEGGSIENFYSPGGQGGRYTIDDSGGFGEEGEAGTFVSYVSKYLLSFNIEVLPDNNDSEHYFDLNENALHSGFDYSNNTDGLSNNVYPIGQLDQQGGNDDGPSPTLPDAIRVTMRVTEGARGVQERVVQRVFWIPAS